MAVTDVKENFKSSTVCIDNDSHSINSIAIPKMIAAHRTNIWKCWSLRIAVSLQLLDSSVPLETIARKSVI